LQSEFFGLLFRSVTSSLKSSRLKGAAEGEPSSNQPSFGKQLLTVPFDSESELEIFLTFTETLSYFIERADNERRDTIQHGELQRKLQYSNRQTLHSLILPDCLHQQMPSIHF